MEAVWRLMDAITTEKMEGGIVMEAVKKLRLLNLTVKVQPIFRTVLRLVQQVLRQFTRGRRDMALIWIETMMELAANN